MPGYSLYVKENRQSIKDNLVGIRDNNELMIIVADKWKNLDDDVRASYTTEANTIAIATTGIRVASKKGYVDIVRLLIEHGADVNVNDIYEDTALILATKNNHADVVRLLLEKGAFTDYLDNQEQLTALDFACAGGYVDICRLLIAKGANVHEFFCIQSACRYGHEEVVRLLLENNANVDHGGSEDYDPPICIASQKGYFDIVKLLIDNGADVNNRDEDGHTALFLASVNNQTQVCKLLIKKGANIPPVPLKTAALEGRAGMCTILRLCGKGGTWDAFEFRRFSYDVLNALKIQPMDKIVIEVKDMIALNSINASAEEKDNSPPCIIDEKEQWVMRLDTVISYVRSGWNSPYGTPIRTVTLLSNQDIIRINQKREQQRNKEELYASERRVEKNEAYQEALRELKEKQALERERLKREMNPQESAYQDTLRAAKRQRGNESKSDSLHVQIQSLRF